jgi:hypothetical protein
MASVIEIINTGLVRIGAQTINALDEGSVEANNSNAIWTIVRRSTLAAHPWNFAIKEQELAQTTDTPIAEYSYIYQLPTDYLRMVKVYDNPDYKIVGRKLYTSANTCKLKYVYDLEDTAAWTAAFTDLVAQKLAFELAYPITKSASLAQTMGTIYVEKLQSFTATDSQEDIQDAYSPYDQNLIAVRF